MSHCPSRPVWRNRQPLYASTAAVSAKVIALYFDSTASHGNADTIDATTPPMHRATRVNGKAQHAVPNSARPKQLKTAESVLRSCGAGSGLGRAEESSVGKSVLVRVDLGVGRIIEKKKKAINE